MNSLDLSIIILNYNTCEITQKCLECLRRSVRRCQKELKNQIEVIVIDNASTDGSVEMLQKHQWIHLIESKTNTGFSGGNNIGMKKAKHPMLLIMNSDLFVQEDTILKSLEYFQKNPACDVMGIKLTFESGKLQPSAGYLPTPLNTIFWISGFALFPVFKNYRPIHPKDANFYKKEKQVEWVMGAYLMLKKAVFEKTKGFDETIFMYGEEVEWCKRIQDAGFKTWYVPTISATHLDKASSGFMLEKPLLNEIKGIVRFFKQHYPSYWPIVRIYMIKWLLIRCLVFLILGKMPRVRAYWEGLKIL